MKEGKVVVMTPLQCIFDVLFFTRFSLFDKQYMHCETGLFYRVELLRIYNTMLKNVNSLPLAKRQYSFYGTVIDTVRKLCIFQQRMTLYFSSKYTLHQFPRQLLLQHKQGFARSFLFGLNY